MGIALAVRSLSKDFGGVHAVDGVDFDAEEGSVLGLIGPNGAGKTTLFNLVSGYLSPTRGTISLFGKEVTGLRPFALARLGVSRTFQVVRPFPRLSVLENVMVGATPRATSGFVSALFSLPRKITDEKRLAAAARSALARVSAEQTADLYPGELSYGMRKRIALARALAASPKVLLLDEPASGLDETELTELGDLIRELSEEESLVVVEHHMDLMMSVCDSITVLDFGKVIAAGTPHEVQQDPAVTAAYLGAGNGKEQA